MRESDGNTSWVEDWRSMMGLSVFTMTIGLFLLVISHSATLQILLTGRLHKPEPLIIPVMIMAQGLAGVGARTKRKAASSQQ
jgi:hypothetical protein